jgi:P4 family phage/plasmid primase-like protien
MRLVRHGEQGHHGVGAALADLRAAFTAAVAPDRDGGRVEALSEFARMESSAADKAAADPTAEADRRCCGTGAARVIDGPLGTHRPNLPDGSLRSVPMGRQFADEALAGRYLYVAGLGWHRWDGCRWADLGPDGQDAVTAEAAAWAEAFIHRLIDTRAPAEAVKAALRYREVGAARSLVEAARLVDSMRVTVDRLDADPHLLNCPNGVVDLRNGALYPSDPALLMTKVAGVEYVPGLEHPDWTAALEALPPQTRDFLQVRLGQALTGHPTPSDELVLCDGGGENGKTSLLGTALAVAGDYGVLVSDRVLLGHSDQHPTELMDFLGARIALLEETPEARRLDTARLKRIVGIEKIKARRIAKDPVEFAPTHSLFISTNYLPVVDETDHGTWRRLRRVRFPYTFRKRPEDVVNPERDRLGDQRLKPRLRRPGSDGAKAALVWMVAGAAVYHADGEVLPPPPPEVEDAGREWRVSADLLLAYADDRLDFDPDACVLTSDLTHDLGEWLTARGNRPWSDGLVASRFGSHSEWVDEVEKRQTTDISGLNRPRFAPPMGRGPKHRVWRGVAFKGGVAP